MTLPLSLNDRVWLCSRSVLLLACCPPLVYPLRKKEVGDQPPATSTSKSEIFHHSLFLICVFNIPFRILLSLYTPSCDHHLKVHTFQLTHLQNTMFFTISRLTLALATPSLLAAQSLTTYSITISNSIHTIVLPTPKVTTITDYQTQPGATTTIIPAPSIQTSIFTVTGPFAEVTSIADNIPSGARVQGGRDSETPGAIVPIAIHGFITSIELPASASIPTGPFSISHVNIIAPTPAIASSDVTEAASAASAAKVAASQEALVASNVAGSAANQASSAVHTVASAVTSAEPVIKSGIASNAVSSVTNNELPPTHLPIPLNPLHSLSASLQSASSAAITSPSTPSIPSSTIESVISSPSIASSAIPAEITTATSLLSTEANTTTLVTTSSAAAATSSVSGASSSASASDSASSSQPPPSPSASSTEAPPQQGGAMLARSVWGGSIVGGIVAAMVVLVM